MRGIVLAGSLGLATAACGGHVEVLNSGQGGSGGSAGTGGTNGAGSGGFLGKGVGGTFSVGGTSIGGSAGTGVAGANVAGGGGTMVPYACPSVTPTTDLISDFDGPTPESWGDPAGFYGGTFVYPAAPSIGEMIADFSNADMTVSGKVSEYSGFGLWFGPCAHASIFSGVEFAIWSNLGVPVTMTFSIQTNPNSPIDPINMRGACQFVYPELMYIACVQPTFSIEVAPEPLTIKVRWGDVSGGIPFAQADPTALVGLLWSFAWSDTAVPYQVEVTIDNVRFF